MNIQLEREILYEEDVFSDCCYAPIYADIGICSKCGDNICYAVKVCPKCNGEGYYWELDTCYMPDNPNLINPPEIEVICDCIDGFVKA